MRKETFRVKTLPSGLCVIDSTVIPEKEARGWNPHEEHICSDCGHKEGYYHHVGCDMPDCPFCGGQLLSCGCVQERLGFSEDLDCLEEDEEERAEKLLAANGWRPFLIFPQICPFCGELWPYFFQVKSEEWERVVPPEHQRAVICGACYNRIAGGETLTAPPRCRRCGKADLPLQELEPPRFPELVCAECQHVLLRFLVKERQGEVTAILKARGWGLLTWEQIQGAKRDYRFVVDEINGKLLQEGGPFYTYEEAKGEGELWVLQQGEGKDA